jgi:tripartite-type tricarboxylate transporter receptor subunit TctC
MVIPYVAGRPMDVIGRALGQKLSQSTLGWGHNFVIDNRAGTGRAIGWATTQLRFATGTRFVIDGGRSL